MLCVKTKKNLLSYAIIFLLKTRAAKKGCFLFSKAILLINVDYLIVNEMERKAATQWEKQAN